MRLEALDDTATAGADFAAEALVIGSAGLLSASGAGTCHEDGERQEGAVADEVLHRGVSSKVMIGAFSAGTALTDHRGG
jgi:hypothetical protein